MYMYIFIYDDDWSAVKGHANEFYTYSTVPALYKAACSNNS